MRNLLRQNAVCVIADLGEWKRIRGQGEHQHRRVGRVGLPVDRWTWQRWRQLAGRRIDRRLHVLSRRIDGAAAAELQRDLGKLGGAARRHLRQVGNLAELPFERRRDGAGDRLRIGAGQLRGDLDRRRVDIRQSRHRQQLVTEQSEQQDRHHQHRGGDRLSDERR
jgi:hypothetical protein